MALAVEAGERWIFEGGFSTTYDNRAQRADTLVWLDLPVSLRLWRVSKRLLRYWGQSRPDMAEGCVEGIHAETLLFYKWIWDTRKSHREPLRALIETYPHLNVSHLRSPADVRAFWRALGAKR
jgi:adenylate kinase family enzyme